jgi:hypothetical protein
VWISPSLVKGEVIDEAKMKVKMGCDCQMDHDMDIALFSLLQDMEFRHGRQTWNQ